MKSVRARQRARGIGSVLIWLIPLGLWGFTNLREDEFECESTIAHLEDCCGDDFAVVSGACDYFSGCGSTAHPILSISDSRCIQDLSCAEINQRELCHEVASLERPGTTVDGGYQAPQEPLCP